MQPQGTSTFVSACIFHAGVRCSLHSGQGGSYCPNSGFALCHQFSGLHSARQESLCECWTCSPASCQDWFPMCAAQQPPLTTNLGEIHLPPFPLDKISCTVSRSLVDLGPCMNWWNCCSQPQTRSPLLSPPHSQVIALRWSHQGGEGVKRELEKKQRERLIEAVEGNCKLCESS